MNWNEDIGYIRAKVEDLEDALGEAKSALAEVKRELDSLSKWMHKAMGFTVAIVFLTQMLTLFLKLKG
jgi:hypothetical protein